MTQYVYLILSLLWSSSITFSVALTSIGSYSPPTLKNQRPAAQTSKQPVSDIHVIDFLNIVYPSRCSKTYPNSGFPDAIRTKKGEWKMGADAQEVYFGIVNQKITFADLKGDGHDQAVVHTACGFSVATESEDEVFVFETLDSKPKLLARLSGHDWGDRTIEPIWRVKGVEVKDHCIIVTFIAGGSHAEPAWNVATSLQWNGSGLHELL